MATFTMYLHEVIASIYGTTADLDDYEQNYDQVTFNGVTYGKLPVFSDYTPLGLGTYPIFDENYRKVLNGKIIDEFWNREIGVETIDLFVFNLRKKMDQIMPYYNQFYESTLIEYSALDTMRIQTVGEAHLEGTENGEANNNSEMSTIGGARAVNSDFPQTMLAGNADYAKGATDTNSKSDVSNATEQSTNTSSSNDSQRESLTTGYQGAASDLITKFRNSIINTDTSVIADTEECFMSILNNGDEYFARAYPYNWR